MLVLPIREGQLPHAQNASWFVGRFQCADSSHDMKDHVYDLKAGDPGKIDIFENHNIDEIIIRVVAKHTIDPSRRNDGVDVKPKISKIKED